MSSRRRQECCSKEGWRRLSSRCTLLTILRFHSRIEESWLCPPKGHCSAASGTLPPSAGGFFHAKAQNVLEHGARLQARAIKCSIRRKKRGCARAQSAVSGNLSSFLVQISANFAQKCRKFSQIFKKFAKIFAFILKPRL